MLLVAHALFKATLFMTAGVVDHQAHTRDLRRLSGLWGRMPLTGTAAVLAVAVAAGLAQSLGKLSLDAIVQRDVDESVRTSAFARTETLLQLSWVVGGGVGIALPLDGELGLGLAAVGLAVMLVITLRSTVRKT